MSKLLYRPLKVFALYALLILALSIPAYYYVVDYIWLSELDENNQIVKARIEKGFAEHKVSDEELSLILSAWNSMQPGTTITPANIADVRADSIYTRLNKSVYDKEMNRFRTLSSYISLNSKPYHLQVEVNVEEADETMTAIAFVTVLFFVLLVAGFVILNRIIAGGLWQPFINTLDKLKAFDLQTNNAIKFEQTDIAEFAELNNVLDKLIASNVTAYKQQKEFTENASHELQTPLALLKTKLDVLLQDKTLTQEQSEHISALGLPLARVSRINKNLLLLAKIENQQYADVEEVDLSALVKENIELFADYFTEKGLAVKESIAEGVTVKGNKPLIEILLTNLLVNAVRHTAVQGAVVIQLGAKAFTVSNTGTNSLRTDVLFQRFKSATINTPNTGLGLAIVSEVVKRYNWTIVYRHENDFHVFEWQFA